MGSCCDPAGYEQVFGNRYARSLARRYRGHGLGRTEERLVGFCVERGIEGASVLEIGGGVGELQIELLRRGAAAATNLELVDSYDAAALELAGAAGVRDRVTRRLLDIAASPDPASPDPATPDAASRDHVEPADVVVMHRVVCCYPDYERLLSAAADHARRLLVFSYPPRNMLTVPLLTIQNGWFRLTGKSFRTFAHPPEAMLEVVRRHGFELAYRHRGTVWRVAGFERRR